MTQDNLLASLSLTVPVFQAPMAGVSTPAMAAAVSEAGGLGALGLGASTVEVSATAISETQARTNRPFNVNFFCHEPAPRNHNAEQAWIARATPLFKKFGAEPPQTLAAIYTSFRENDHMLKVVLSAKPTVASFHFGLPHQTQLDALRQAGIKLIATATSLAEAQKIEQAGLDAIVAQGWEAGGHRGIFDPDAPDERLSTETLTRLLAQKIGLPIIAAGGIIDGQDVKNALEWGAVAAQLGTAFVGSPESSADGAYRRRLEAGGKTVMTSVISGRPARCLENRFTEWGQDVLDSDLPGYPCTYSQSTIN